MMRSRRSAGRIGFVKKADTPAARACSTSFALAWAVRKITGVREGGARGGTTPAGRVPARKCLRKSRPLTGSISISLTMTSISLALNISSAVPALAASKTVLTPKPRRIDRISDRVKPSSSTTRTMMSSSLGPAAMEIHFANGGGIERALTYEYHVFAIVLFIHAGAA